MNEQSKKRWVVAVIGLAFALFHLYTAAFGQLPALQQRAVHLSFALVLAFLLKPSKRAVFRVLDYLEAALSVAPSVYIIGNYEHFMLRFVYTDRLTALDTFVAVLTILLLLDATRRVVGWAMPITACVFLAYAFFSPYLPGILNTRGYSLSKILDYQFMFYDGIFGTPLATSASFIILFIIFGALMEKTGTGQMFIDSATAIAGGRRGGPAKVAVISSCVMGTISGSAVANVTTTGVFTIPMMKKLGYSKDFAGAVEAVASTGGQIMPPVMGAAAFIMAELTSIPYVQIIKYALLPALLYYFAVYMGIHFEALKLDLKVIPKEERPNFMQVMREKGLLVIPLVVIVAVLVSGYSTSYSALLGIAAIIVVSSIKRDTRMSVRGFLEALAEGATGTVLVALACACAGMIVGVVTMTGLGVRISSALLSLSGGSLLPILLIAAFVGIILGCGLPVSASYVIMVAVLIPSLVKLGIPVVAAHLFCLYYAVLSNITPPVALSAYAAAGISGASAMTTAVQAVKLGFVAFIVPFMFVYAPELLLIGSFGSIALAVCTAVVGTACFAAATRGWLRRETTLLERLLLIALGLLLIYPGWVTDLIGLGLLAAVLLLQWKRGGSFVTVRLGGKELKLV